MKVLTFFYYLHRYLYYIKYYFLFLGDYILNTKEVKPNVSQTTIINFHITAKYTKELNNYIIINGIFNKHKIKVVIIC